MLWWPDSCSYSYSLVVYERGEVMGGEEYIRESIVRLEALGSPWALAAARRKRELLAAREARVAKLARLSAGEKYCPRCEAYIGVDKFYRSSYARDGLTTYCKTHHYQISRLARKRSPPPQEETVDASTAEPMGVSAAEPVSASAAEPVKTCRLCGVSVLANEFPKRGRGACKVCVRANEKKRGRR